MEYHELQSISSRRDVVETSTRIEPLPAARKKLFLGSAPVVMLGLLGLGALAAVGHLLYYHSLDGSRVSSSSVSQEWNIRIGTGLALIAMTAWTVTVVVAQAQRVWQTQDQKQLGLNTIDAVLTAATDFSAFRRGSMLARAKLATLLAFVVWLIPLSAVFTPATLTVVPNDRRNSRVIQETVPNIDFDSAAKFAGLATCSASRCGLTDTPSGIATAIQFRYPNAQTIVEIVSTMSSGRIQSMSPQYPNSTYTTSFYGPVFNCSAANSSTVTEIDRIDQLTNTTSSASVTYYAFVPGLSSNNTLVAVDFAKLPTTWSEITNATVPVTSELWIKSGANANEDYHVCAFYNATYNVEVSFASGVQSTTLQSLTDMTAQPYVVAAASWPDDGSGPVGYPFRVLSYQSLFIGLARQLIGRFDPDPLNTPLFQTPVIGTSEFDNYFEQNFGTDEQPFASNLTIPQVVEQLSQNITLSLLSSAKHAGTGTTARVTVYDDENLYSFNQTALVLTYALTLAVVAACVFVGLRAVADNRGTRTAAFSAMVWAAKDAQMREGDVSREAWRRAEERQ